MCESYNIQYKTNYICLMPTNTFGPNDNYNLQALTLFLLFFEKYI